MANSLEEANRLIVELEENLAHAKEKTKTELEIAKTKHEAEMQYLRDESNGAKRRLEARIQTLISERDEARQLLEKFTSKQDETKKSITSVDKTVSSVDEKLDAVLALLQQGTTSSEARMSAPRSDVFSGELAKQARIGIGSSVRESAVAMQLDQSSTAPSIHDQNQNPLHNLAQAQAHASGFASSSTAPALPSSILTTGAASSAGTGSEVWKAMTAGKLGDASSTLQFAQPSQLPQDLRELVEETIAAGRKAHVKKGTQAQYIDSLRKGSACARLRASGSGTSRTDSTKLDEACQNCIAKQRVCIEAVSGQDKFILMPLPVSDRANVSETDKAYYVKP
jgi:hypothetical protein